VIPSGSVPQGMIYGTGRLDGMDLVVAITALLGQVNGVPPADSEIAEALSKEGLPSIPSAVDMVRKHVALLSQPTGEVAPTDDDEDWGDPIDRLPADIEARLGLSTPVDDPVDPPTSGEKALRSADYRPCSSCGSTRVMAKIPARCAKCGAAVARI
jgi:hypothetical protein